MNGMHSFLCSVYFFRPLLQLGINEIFSDTADLSNIFEGSISDSKVTKVQHKTFINLNEVGCEATGTTCKFLPTS